jgi:hypothetical protein
LQTCFPSSGCSSHRPTYLAFDAPICSSFWYESAHEHA